MWLEILFIFGLIVLLYAKTYNYKWTIDDICVRNDYLNRHTEEYAKEEKERNFQNLRRAWWITPESIGIHLLSCLCIYLIWGFHPAIIFAVFPLNIHAVAWATGMRLYGSATLLVLISHYLSKIPTELALGASAINLFTALHTAISPLFYPFYKLFMGKGIEKFIYFIPLFLFLAGKRFRNGLKKRVDSHHNLNVNESGKILWKRIFIVPKVMGWYVHKTIWPSRIGFFSEPHGYLHNYARDKWFYSYTTLFMIFVAFALLVDPDMAIWWLFSIGIFSQFMVFGQFTSIRYTILANVAWSVLISKVLDPYQNAFIILATLYFAKTWIEVKKWRNSLVLFSNNAESDPKCPDAHNNAGLAFMQAGHPAQAISHWLAARNYGWTNTNILINLATAYGKVGDFDKAIIHCIEALKDIPKDRKKEMEDMLIGLQNQKRKMFENKKLLRKMLKD